MNDDFTINHTQTHGERTCPQEDERPERTWSTLASRQAVQASLNACIPPSQVFEETLHKHANDAPTINAVYKMASARGTEWGRELVQQVLLYQDTLNAEIEPEARVCGYIQVGNT